MTSGPEHNELSLKEEETLALRGLLRKLRQEYGIKYISLAREISYDVKEIHKVTGRRSPGTDVLFDKVMAFCARNAIDTSDLSKSSGIATLLKEMNISSKTVDDSIDLSGKYMFFSFIDHNTIGVAWVELYEKSKLTPLPSFTMWRPSNDSNVIVNGLYYTHETTLFMGGHKAETSLARFIATVPVGGRTKDRYGFISGSSASETLFQSFCFMKKLPDSTIRKRVVEMFGEIDLNTFNTKFPAESKFLDSREKYHFSLRKSSG